MSKNTKSKQHTSKNPKKSANAYSDDIFNEINHEKVNIDFTQFQKSPEEKETLKTLKKSLFQQIRSAGLSPKKAINPPYTA